VRTRLVPRSDRPTGLVALRNVVAGAACRLELASALHRASSTFSHELIRIQTAPLFPALMSQGKGTVPFSLPQRHELLQPVATFTTDVRVEPEEAMVLLARYEPQIYAVFRIVAGLLFSFHGAQKLLGLFGGKKVPLASLAGGAGVIELVGGILILIGLAAGIAAFICSGEMAAAYFMVHQPQGTWPIQNQGELAALYCFVFLYIAARGSGIWSVDAARGPSVQTRRAL
jgi:putative oxidoreductase